MHYTEERYRCPHGCCPVKVRRNSRRWVIAVYLHGERLDLEEHARALGIRAQSLRDRLGIHQCISKTPEEFAAMRAKRFCESWAPPDTSEFLNPAAPDPSPVAAQFLALRWP